MSIIALASDLMLSLQVQESGTRAGLAIAVASSLEALQEALRAGAVRLVLFDLADRAFPLEETVAMIRGQTPRPTILAFHPHVRKDLAEAAERSGCELVMPRSRFLLDLPAALQSGLALAPDPSVRRSGETIT